nr:hypothetical protein Q903MT_gene1623 [Picea sitchensis]
MLPNDSEVISDRIVGLAKECASRLDQRERIIYHLDRPRSHCLSIIFTRLLCFMLNFPS